MDILGSAGPCLLSLELAGPQGVNGFAALPRTLHLNWVLKDEFAKEASWGKGIAGSGDAAYESTEYK